MPSVQPPWALPGFPAWLLLAATAQAESPLLINTGIDGLAAGFPVLSEEGSVPHLLTGKSYMLVNYKAF